AQRVRELCSGSPRDLMRLAQHLVDRGVVRYAAGAWTLPREIDAGDLPASLSEALSSRLAALPEAARGLACGVALCPDQSFSFEECGQLSARLESAARVALIEALISADVAQRAGDDVRLSQRSWVALLLARMSGEQASELQRRLASLFERRGGQE